MSTRTIWKYPIGGGAMISMPRGGIIRHLAVQHGQPTIWVELDPSEPQESRQFVMYGTGHPIYEGASYEYIGTIQDAGFVWHFYEQLAQ